MIRPPGVLVTRPQAQAEGLCRQIEALGWRALPFPLLQIVPLSPPPLEVSAYAGLIFISRNAVIHGLPLLRGDLPALAVVGKGSAAELARRGVDAQLQPTVSADSEGLLALPALQRLTGQRWLIVRGQGGRELLAEALRGRGAEVDYFEVYARRPPCVGWPQLRDCWDEVDLVLASSNEALENLLNLLGEEALQRLADKTLLVVSDRGRELAWQRGVRRLIQAEGASDEALINAMLRWAEDGNLAIS